MICDFDVASQAAKKGTFLVGRVGRVGQICLATEQGGTEGSVNFCVEFQECVFKFVVSICQWQR